MTTTNPHIKPAIAGGIGAAVGILSAVQAYFGSGHIPSGAEVAGILGGLGVTGASVWKFIESHTHITEAELAHDAQVVAADAKTLAPVVTEVAKDADPSLVARLEAVEAKVAAEPLVKDAESEGKSIIKAIFGGKKIFTTDGQLDVDEALATPRANDPVAPAEAAAPVAAPAEPVAAGAVA